MLLFFFQSSATVMREVDLFTQLLTSASARNWVMSGTATVRGIFIEL